MATVASSHGGDGGGQHPNRHVSRIPADCESRPRRKGVRGPGSGKNLLKAFEDNNYRPLPLVLDPMKSSFKFVGETGSYFGRQITQSLKRVAPYYENWESVPDDDRKGIFRTLHHFFDLQSWSAKPEWKSIKPAIESECARKYRDRKCDLKKHFKSVGGKENLEEAKKNHHSTVTPDDWLRLIDEVFLNPEKEAIALQNAANKAKQPYPHTNGSKSYAQIRYEEVQQGREFSLVENWRQGHLSDGVWINPAALETWGRIQEVLQEMQLETPKGQAVDEEEVLARALGQRSGWK